jgi:O-antigen ligase
MAQQTADMLGTSVVETDSSRWLRAYGTFPHPNILGGWLVVSLLSLIAVSRGLVQEVRGAKDKITKMRFAIRYLFFAVIVFGLLATFSRSAWLAALIGIGIFIIISIKEKLFRRLAIKLTGILIIVVVLFGALFPDQLSSRINNQDRLEVKSTQERVAGFGEAWEVIKQNRILGTGIGNYGLAVHQDIDNSQPSYCYQPAHNVLMLVWAELGIVVLFSILYFLSSIFMRKKRMRILRAGILFLPIIIISLFDHYLWSLYSGMMILMVYFSIFFLKLGKK